MLAALALILTAGVATSLTGLTVYRLSMGTAYASFALLSVALLLGPWNVLRGRPNPVSTHLRRDVGIWAALMALAHTVFGLQVHIPGRPWQYFLWPFDQQRLFPLRYDAAGAANHPGLVSMLILLLLLALSSDAALRRLGAPRWKSLQRWNYAAFLMMSFHAVIYQLLEKRSPPVMALFAIAVMIVVAVQVAGWRRRRAGNKR